jgi:hypothetical protein
MHAKRDTYTEQAIIMRSPGLGFQFQYLHISDIPGISGDPMGSAIHGPSPAALFLSAMLTLVTREVM